MNGRDVQEDSQSYPPRLLLLTEGTALRRLPLLGVAVAWLISSPGKDLLIGAIGSF
jgi:hypothetical protein